MASDLYQSFSDDYHDHYGAFKPFADSLLIFFFFCYLIMAAH